MSDLSQCQRPDFQQYHTVEFTESLQYIFKHGVIKMYFTWNCEGYINLLDFFPILKNGKALYDTMIKMFFIYINCNHLIMDNHIVTDQLLGTFNKQTITLEEVGQLINLQTTLKLFPATLTMKLKEENKLINNVDKTIYDNKIYIYIGLSKFNSLLTNPYIKIIDYIRKGYTLHDLFKFVDIRRYDNAIYRYAMLIRYSTANINIANSIVREIVRLTWYEKQVIETVIQSLIGKTSIPKDIHSHLLYYISQ